MTKPKKTPLTAAQVLTVRKEQLEEAILRACAAFERETGLCVRRIHHPRDNQNDYGSRKLTDKDRIGVTAITPFS